MNINIILFCYRINEAFCVLALLEGKFRLQPKLIGSDPTNDAIPDDVEHWSDVVEKPQSKNSVLGRRFIFEWSNWLINGLMIYWHITVDHTLNFHRRADLNMKTILVPLVLPPWQDILWIHTSHVPD